MSDAVPTRIILFEVADGLYALPISDVLEVLENQTPVGIPTLAPEVGGVVNHHGETLPVIAAGALFAGSVSETEPEHLLVLGGLGSDAGQLGIPVERVLGLAEAPLDDAPCHDWIRTRITIEGRVVAVLDGARCLARAESQFTNSVVRKRGAQDAPAGLDTMIQELSTEGESL